MKEGKRLEASLIQCMDKTAKANADSAIAKLQEDAAKKERSERDRERSEREKAQAAVVAAVVAAVQKEVASGVGASVTSAVQKSVQKDVGPAVASKVVPAVEAAVTKAVQVSRSMGEGKLGWKLDKCFAVRMKNVSGCFDGFNPKHNRIPVICFARSGKHTQILDISGFIMKFRLIRLTSLIGR